MPRDGMRDRAPWALSATLPTLTTATTLPNRLYAELEAAIINGVLDPGSRLHADDLANHFGVSIIPVREALSSLDQAGWVEIVPRHGVHVRARTETELGELFEFRADVEGVVARLAAERRTEHDLAALDAAVRDAAPHPSWVRASESDKLLDASAAFRDRMRNAAHNSVLSSTSATLEKRARFYFSTVVDQLGDEWMRVHRQVLDHVRNQEAAAAADLTSKHIVATGEAVRALLFR